MNSSGSTWSAGNYANLSSSLNGYGFNLRDAQGNTRYRVAVDGEGSPTVQLFDAQGNVIWSAP